MKKSRVLVNILHWFFVRSFWLLILFFIYQVYSDIFIDDGEIVLSKGDDNKEPQNFDNDFFNKKDTTRTSIRFGMSTLTSSNHHSKGYLIPISFRFILKKPYTKTQINYTILKKDSLGNSIGPFGGEISSSFSSDSYADSFSEESISLEEGDSIVSFKKELTKHGSLLKFRYMESPDVEYLQAIDGSVSTPATLLVKSTNMTFTVLQIIRLYIGAIIFIFIFYHLKKIFKQLKSKISFSIELSKRIKYIGLLFISLEVINLTISFLFSRYYGYIGFDLQEVFEYSNDIDLNINPRLDFDITSVIIGLSLIVFSILLKEGSLLKQENELTI